MAGKEYITVIGEGPACARFAEKLARSSAQHGVEVRSRADALGSGAAVTSACVIWAFRIPSATLGLVKRMATSGRRVLVCGDVTDGTDVLDLLLAGAHGILHPEARPDELTEALRLVRADHMVLPPASLTGLVLHLRKAQGTPTAQLSGREREVLRLVARGFTYKRIADRLSLSPHTVKNHVHRAMRRLGVATRMEAAQLLLTEK